MLKTSKRYVLNTNDVNNYGYRVLSEGIDLSQYNNNSIMLWMHYRPNGASRDEVLCVGNIREIEVDEDGVMTGQPYFDDTDDFAVKLYNKYENGTYNMFSICALPLEGSMEPEDMLPGQTGPTITRSLMKEISGVDIGGNPKAHGVMLVDADLNEIKLSDSFIQSIITTPKINNTEMSKTLITRIGALLPEIKLSDTFTDNEKIIAIEGLIALADRQMVELSEAQAKVVTAEGKIAEAQKEAKKQKVIALLDKGERERRFLPGQRKHYEVLAEINFEGTEALINSMPINRGIELKDGEGAQNPELDSLIKLSWDELDKANKLPLLKKLSEASFKLKFKERFGREINE